MTHFLSLSTDGVTEAPGATRVPLTLSKEA